ncbi:unnamed protein product [Meloidogyne enterolobii]|uniref:Uncharacterized protein n=1 Tax=Meloidogyne enterolobii TaxID=390850 RepID=A0ACB0XLN8_MELEN
MFILLIISSLFSNSHGTFESESKRIINFLGQFFFNLAAKLISINNPFNLIFSDEASSSKTKSLNQKENMFDKHRENFVNKKYLPLYKNEIWSPTENDFKEYPKREQEFKIGEFVKVRNGSKSTGKTEWLSAKIVEFENKQYTVEIQNKSLYGKLFTRYSKDIRKITDDFQINEIVELRNYDKWVLGRILGKDEEGMYIVGIESGEFYGVIVRRYPNHLKKHGELEHYKIDEIVEVMNIDKITGEINWIKAKILEIKRGNNYIVKIVEKCRLNGSEFERNIFSIRKFKSENFQAGEEVEFYIYDRIKKKNEWIKAKILQIEDGIYVLNTGTKILREYYSFNLRKIQV